MRGTVTSSDDGVPMAGVEVTLVDESTGAVKTTSTNEDGSFAFTGLQIGGPYHVVATLQGFKSSEETGIFLSANKVRDVALAMHLQEEVIEVSGAPVIRSTSNRTVVTAVEIDELPSVGRDPRDVVRRNPEVSVEGRDRTLSIGGANTRFNSITVDGIRQDDDFGLNLSGYPTRRSPIALSAIQELTVDSSPFDVHYGKFLGGNVNIVTKSGTNELKGSLVSTYSSDALLGSRSGNKRINVDYSEFRYGGTVGGPIIKDKLHFLISAEGLNASTPTSVGPAGSGAVNVSSKVSQDAMTMIQNIARDAYKFDPGGPSQSLNEGDFKLFAKLDYVVDPRNRATVSFQRTGGNSIQQASSSDTTLALTSDWYDARDTLYTFSGRLFSDWSDQLSTEVEVNAKLVRSQSPPLNGNGFMQATINTQMTDADPSTGGRIVLGPDQFRHANSIDNDVLHGKAEANYLLKNHLITGGFEYELLRINDLFVPGSNGVAQYASIEDFMNLKPSALTYSNAVTQDPQDGAAKWKNATWTAYAQDQYKITNELSVQAGARVELYTTSDHIARNQNFVNRYADTLGISNTENLNGRSIFMPRLGVSYLPIDHLNVRAGLGLYSGGTPNVWVTNNYGNDGVRISSVTSRDPAIINGFNGRDIPMALKDQVAAGNGNVDVLDPKFKIPSAWKAGIGADYSLDIPGLDDYGKNLGLKVNYTFTKIRDGVNWIDLRRDLAILPNNQPVGTTPDGRPLYSASFNVSRGYDMMLTNTDRGYGHVASFQIDKSFPFGLYLAGSYAYQDVHEVNPATSSRSVSNYGIAALVDPNDPTDGVSIYERKHRFTGTIEYSHPVASYFTDSGPWKNMRTALGLFVESRSGQPYTWTFGATENGRDTNGTKLGKIFGEDTTFSSRNRELFYVPTDAEVCEGPAGVAPPAGCNVVLSNGTNKLTREDFNKFLQATGLDKYRGQIVPRNAFHSPWFNKLDMRFAQDLPNPVNDNRARFVVDIENVGNLLNHDWGRSRSVPFPYFAPAVDLDYDRANNKYIYSNVKSPNATTVDVLQSVWRVSLGLMYDF
ncbi:MAG TPA: TonB-dependent receptor [Kofleriaceae bacterium]|nr:TonB-dependent receptor [Kofleriaceae bacterium]